VWPMPTTMRFTSIVNSMLSVAAAMVGCDDSAPAPPIVNTETWEVDCVAVLGTLPPSAQMPLESIPYSGVARDKRISDLSDEERGRLCDFGVCLRANGYRRRCGRQQFPLETIDLLYKWNQTPLTCYPIAPDDPGPNDSLYSRESCVALGRTQNIQCTVGLSEDCTRERASNPIGAIGWGPSCELMERTCLPPP
jgi:hypothetical protein